MSESGGEHRPHIEAEKKPTIPERFNHRGTAFESPEADTQLSFVRERVASDRSTPTAIDLLDIVGCEIDDVNEQKKYIMGGKEALAPAERGLKRIHETLLHVATQEFDEINGTDRKNVLAYINRQKKRWELRASDENSTALLREEAAENQELFNALRENVFSAEAIQEYIGQGIIDAESYANEDKEKSHPSLKIPEMFPEYKYKPDKANSVLKEIQEKSDELTFDDAMKYYEATMDDVDQQEKEYRGEHPGWADKETAVRAALSFKKVREDEVTPDKQIHVSILPDGAIHFGWELTSKNPEGTKNYTFTLTGEEDNPNDLNRHAKNVDFFVTKKKALQKNMEAVSALKDHDETFLTNLSDDDEETINAVKNTLGVLDQHRDILSAKGDSSERDIEILDGIAELVKERAGMSDEEEVWYHTGDPLYDDEDLDLK